MSIENRFSILFINLSVGDENKKIWWNPQKRLFYYEIIDTFAQHNFLNDSIVMEIIERATWRWKFKTNSTSLVFQNEIPVRIVVRWIQILMKPTEKKEERNKINKFKMMEGKRCALCNTESEHWAQCAKLMDIISQMNKISIKNLHILCDIFWLLFIVIFVHVAGKLGGFSVIQKLVEKFECIKFRWWHTHTYTHPFYKLQNTIMYYVSEHRFAASNQGDIHHFSFY